MWERSPPPPPPTERLFQTWRVGKKVRRWHPKSYAWRIGSDHCAHPWRSSKRWHCKINVFPSPPPIKCSCVRHSSVIQYLINANTRVQLQRKHCVCQLSGYRMSWWCNYGHRKRSDVRFANTTTPPEEVTLLMENTSDGWKILHDHTSADNG